MKNKRRKNKQKNALYLLPEMCGRANESRKKNEKCRKIKSMEFQNKKRKLIKSAENLFRPLIYKNINNCVDVTHAAMRHIRQTNITKSKSLQCKNRWRCKGKKIKK